jgi:hypothetical protein
MILVGLRQYDHRGKADKLRQYDLRGKADKLRQCQPYAWNNLQKPA